MTTIATTEHAEIVCTAARRDRIGTTSRTTPSAATTRPTAGGSSATHDGRPKAAERYLAPARTPPSTRKHTATPLRLRRRTGASLEVMRRAPTSAAAGRSG